MLAQQQQQRRLLRLSVCRSPFARSHFISPALIPSVQAEALQAAAQSNLGNRRTSKRGMERYEGLWHSSLRADHFRNDGEAASAFMCKQIRCEPDNRRGAWRRTLFRDKVRDHKYRIGYVAGLLSSLSASKRQSAKSCPEISKGLKQSAKRQRRPSRRSTRCGSIRHKPTGPSLASADPERVIEV